MRSLRKMPNCADHAPAALLGGFAFARPAVARGLRELDGLPDPEVAIDPARSVPVLVRDVEPGDSVLRDR